jgi:hypothetical protein
VLQILHTHVRLAFNLFLFAALCTLAFIFVISTQSVDEINYLDNFWYLNRARLIWQGVLPDLFVYTLTYPTVVGLVNLVVNDVILAGMLVNTVLLVCLLTGVYTLGLRLYGKHLIAWLSVALLFINISLIDLLRLFWPTLSFMTVIVWLVVAFLALIRKPLRVYAVALGALLALSTYTRIEGITYVLLIPIAIFIIYRETRNSSLAIQLAILSTVPMLLLCVPLIWNFLYVQQNIERELSTAVTGIFTLLDRTPIEWNVIWRRLTDTLTGLLSHFPLVGWIVGTAGVLWASHRNRFAQTLCAFLIFYNFIYTFVLAIWPYYIHIIFFMPFMALLTAATFTEWLERRDVWRYASIGLLAIVLLPGISHFFMRATSVPILAYRNFELAQTGMELDQWLREQGWFDRRIYSFCPTILSFSQANMQLIYRLQFTTGWDTPSRLIAQIRRENALLMICDNEVFFPDWRFVNDRELPAELYLAGQFEMYMFYASQE